MSTGHPDNSQMVISGAEQITREWLTGVLRKHDPANAVTVGSIRILLEKHLPYSTIICFAVEYKDPTVTLPQNFVLKLAPGNVIDSTTTDIGRAEVEFYRSVAPLMPVPPLVKCYDTGFCSESADSHILMEDLSNTHSQPDQNQIPSPEMSRRAVEALATAHASWWNSPALGTSIGKLFDDDVLCSFVTNLRQSVAAFIDQFGVSLAYDHRQAYESMLNNAERIWGRLMRREDLTVTHGDCHWWNFLYPSDPDIDQVRIFDWHLWHIDLGARDLAFLLALGGFAEPRPEIETELLRAYYGKLCESGVSGYSWDQMLDDYRWSSIRNLNIPVIFWKQGKHESTVVTALRRGFESFERLECTELIA